MNLFGTNKKVDRRKKLRQPFSGNIFYEYRSRLFRANLKNFSPNGFFINATDFFVRGDTIDIAIPNAHDNHDKYKGIIIWSNHEGCGVKFLEDYKESDLTLKTIEVNETESINF